VLLPDRAVVPITSLDLLQPARRLPPDIERTVRVPAPAATTMPPIPAHAPTSDPPTPGPPVSGPPVIPAQRPTPSPPARPAPIGAAMPVQIELEFTEAGLPRRSPDPQPPLADASGLSQGMPDPETVRARLSSLASGIAAANRDTPHQSSDPPPTR
jgi:hypothetical protein